MRAGTISFGALIAFLALGLSLTPQNPGSAPAQALPSADEIFEKYLAATGGTEARKSLQTLAVTGEFGYGMTHPLGSYSYSYKASSSDVLETDMLSHGISWIGHSNGRPFTRNTVGGLVTINDVNMGVIEQDYYSLLEWDLRRNYAAIEVIGQTRVGNRRAYKVQFTSKQGDPVIRYYDAETFLLLRMDQRQWDPQEQGGPHANDLIESDFTDYRDYGGLKLPHLITVNLPPRPLMFQINKAKPNAKIADSAFR
jgi:hypothetical protein